LLLNDPQGIKREVGNDAIGHLRPYALDQASSEIPTNTLEGGRQYGGVTGDLELAAVLRVALPSSLQPQTFAWLGTKQVAHDGQQLTATATRAHPCHRVAGLLVGVGDPLQRRFQGGEWQDG